MYVFSLLGEMKTDWKSAQKDVISSLQTIKQVCVRAHVRGFALHLAFMSVQSECVSSLSWGSCHC